MDEDLTTRRRLFDNPDTSVVQKRSLTGYHHFRRLELVLSFLDRLGNDLLLLDAGCGDGVQMEFLMDRHRTIGTDISMIRLERARSHLDDPDLFQADLLDLPLHDSTFDVVILGEVLEHLKEPKIVLDEIRRILKPGGRIILDTPSQTNMVDLIGRAFGTKPRWSYGLDETHVSFFTMREVVQLLANSGYDSVRIRGGPFLRYELPIVHHCTWVKRRWWIYRLFDYAVAHIPFLNRLGAIQVFMATKPNGPAEAR